MNDLYFSDRRVVEDPDWAVATEDAQGRFRDRHGRYISRWNGPLCDRIGCGKKHDGPKARFCAEHRREHADQLRTQLEAIVAAHRQKYFRVGPN